MSIRPGFPKPQRRAPRPAKRIGRTSRPAKVRKTSLGALKRRLWVLFATYVKNRDGNVCFTCDKPALEGHDWQAGHLIRIGKGSTAYHPDNVHPQCHRCNVWLRGNLHEYTARFIDRFGIEKFRALIARSREHKAWKPHEVEELIAALEKGGADYELLYAEKYA